MAKPYKMTAARRAALKKAQLASARKRKGRGKSVGSSGRKRTSSSKSATSSKRKKLSTKKRLAVAAAVGAAYGYGQVLMQNYEISKTGTLSGYGGRKFRQVGPQFMQFYGKGMSFSKERSGFNRHFNAHATPTQKANRHLREMGYGQNNVTLTRTTPRPGQLALPAGKSSRKRKRYGIF
jgi:hypothetical protein